LESAPFAGGSTLVLLVGKDGGSGSDAAFARRTSEEEDCQARWDNACVSFQDAPPASVRVLGAVCGVARDGSIIEVPSASQRRLLGLLAVHAPRQLRAEWLADVLGVTSGALRTTISRLRAAIGPATLRTASTGYSLEGDVDAIGFCSAVGNADKTADKLGALEQALTLWTGPALEEFQGEEWARGETARLTEIHAACVDDYMEQLIRANRPTDAVAAAEGQIGEYPYRDRSRGLLIRALALAGRQADALRAFQTYRSLLVGELGTEPSHEVVQIECRVATGWNGIDPECQVPAPIGVFEVPIPASLAHRVAFVGRSDEQEVLRTQLTLVEQSGLRCVVVGGEAGIGKTTLLAEFANSVSASGTAIVLYGRCDESGVPLEPFRTVLDMCVEHAPLDLLTEHVAQVGGELTRLCSRLATRLATTPPPTGSDDATERFLAFNAAIDLLRRIASRRPLVLILDDLQWAEPTALLLLRQLVRTLADAPVLVLMSRRDPGEQISDQLRAALSELERGEVSHLQLTGFDEGELAELVVAATRAAPDPELRRITGRLREETAGNPLYASQLVRHWMDLGRAAAVQEGNQGRPMMVMPAGVPPSLREVVWSRVQTLGQDVFTVLAAASVLGLEFPEDVLLKTLDLPKATVLGALDAAVAAGILIDVRYVRRSMRFVHALVASAMYSEIGPSNRAGMHERIVRALTEGGESLHPDVVLQLARHCVLAGLPEDALHWSISAGDHAFDHLAPTEAAQHYQVALEAAEALHRPDAQRADLLVRLGHAQYRAGDPRAQVNLFQGATLARRSGQSQTLIRAALVADLGVIRVDSLAREHAEVVESALQIADPADIATYARLQAVLAKSLTYTPEVERRVALAHRALRLAEESDDATLLARVAPAVLAALWAPGNESLRNEVAAKALSAAEVSGDPLLQFSVNLAARQVAIESGDPVMAAHTLNRLRVTAQSVGEPYLRWLIVACDTFEAMMAGQLSDAERLAAEALDFGLRIGAPDAFAMYAAQYFVLGTFGGRHAELLPLVEQAARENPSVLPFRLAHGIICVAVGDVDAAREILHEGMEGGFAVLDIDNFWMTSVIAYGIIAIELDDRDAAAQLLPVLEPYAAQVSFNGVTSQGPVAAYVGKLASLLGRHDEAERQLRTALATATAFGWIYHQATTLFALAQARHRRLGALDEEGRSWLSESSALCRTYGFRNWISLIDDLAASQVPTVSLP
jgi:DNA-binding SARP family transcriptional activator